MISGEVTADGIPIIEISVGGRQYICIVDTGFNGDLELPVSLRSQVKTKFMGRFHSLLAGNKLVQENTYQVEFPFDGKDVRAEATFSDSKEILLGTNMLRQYRLEIVFPDRIVRLKRMDDA